MACERHSRRSKKNLDAVCELQNRDWDQGSKEWLIYKKRRNVIVKKWRSDEWVDSLFVYSVQKKEKLKWFNGHVRFENQ